MAIQSEILLDSCREVLEQCRHEAAQTRRNSFIDSNASVPLIFDARGDFGKLARKVRDVEGPDVPTESQVEDLSSFGEDRAGEALMSLRDYFATCVPKKVLVEFRDVFGSSSITPSSTPVEDPLEPTRTVRDTSLTESFGTFGPRVRRGSGESINEDDDCWSYTLSAYGTDGEEDSLGYRGGRRFLDAITHHSRYTRTACPYPTSATLHSPQTDSPLSLPSTELVTPDHITTELRAGWHCLSCRDLPNMGVAGRLLQHLFRLCPQRRQSAIQNRIKHSRIWLSKSYYQRTRASRSSFRSIR